MLPGERDSSKTAPVAGAKASVSLDVRGRKVAAGPLPPDLRDEFTYSVISLGAADAAKIRPAPKAPTPVKKQDADKRGNERLRTRLRAGQVSDRGNKVLVDCLIQDRSRTGARLRLAVDTPLPKSFLLSDSLSDIRFLAHLAWQKGCEAGVKLSAL